MSQKKSSINILVLLIGKDTPSARIRINQIINRLNKDTFKVRTVFIPKGFLQRILAFLFLPKSDVILLQKKLLNSFYMFLLKRAGGKIIYDIDDAIWTSDKPISNDENQISFKKKFESFIKHVDMAVAGNHYLADYVQSFNVKTVIIPTTVDCEKYPIAKHCKKESLIIVWIGTSGNLWCLDEVFPSLVSLNNSGAKIILRVICSKPYQPKEFDGGPFIEFIPWKEEKEGIQLSECHIGIMPLADNSWTRGKCGYKILQYQAAGLPVVASAVGANKKIINHMDNGLLVNRVEEWEKYLDLLIQNKELRIEMGIKGRENVENHYSADMASRLLSDVLTKIARSS